MQKPPFFISLPPTQLTTKENPKFKLRFVWKEKLFVCFFTHPPINFHMVLNVEKMVIWLTPNSNKKIVGLSDCWHSDIYSFLTNIKGNFTWKVICESRLIRSTFLSSFSVYSNFWDLSVFYNFMHLKCFFNEKTFPSVMLFRGLAYPENSILPKINLL